MSKLFVILLLLLQACGLEPEIVNKKEVFKRLTEDNELSSALNHFSILIENDSIPKINDNPVIINIVISEQNSTCSLIATRHNMTFEDATVLGETILNDYKVIVHSKNTSLASLLLNDICLSPFVEDKTIIDSSTQDSNFYYDRYNYYDASSYFVVYSIDKSGHLHYEMVFPRSESEMKEWGIDIKARLEKIK